MLLASGRGGDCVGNGDAEGVCLGDPTGNWIGDEISCNYGEEVSSWFGNKALGGLAAVVVLDDSMGDGVSVEDVNG